MAAWKPGKVRIGVDALRRAVRGKRIALMMNHSALDERAENLIDVLHRDGACEIAFLFGMEHGVRGDSYAGEEDILQKDPRTGLPVVSLYRFPDRRPPADVVSQVEAVVFCAQDVGLRHWTYTPWMMYLLDAASECGTEVIVVDRPNLLGGETVEGPVTEEAYFSILGAHDYPLRHGMTVGELAKLYAQEKGLSCPLTVIPCSGWTRSMWGDETGLFWTPPSPNISCFEALIGYSVTGLLQSTSVNIGIGTTTPFTVIGAPWMDGPAFAREINALNIPGFFCTDTYFKPHFSLYSGQVLSGVRFAVTDRSACSAVECLVKLSVTLRRMYAGQFTFNAKMYDERSGSDFLRRSLEAGAPAELILDRWREQRERFLPRRARYLLYD